MPNGKTTAMMIMESILAAPKLIEQIYGDLAQPGVREVGKALGSVLGLGNTILIPIRLINEAGKMVEGKNLDKLRIAFSQISYDEIVEVPPEIGVPILDKLSYVKDDALSDLYINLLKNAASKNYCEKAHPAFVKIIENLSPDEALIIQKIGEDQFRHQPTMQLKTKNKDGGYMLEAKIFTRIEKECNLVFPQNLTAYLNNLARSGIIKVYDDKWYTDESCYEELMLMHSLDKKPKPKNVEEVLCEWEKGFFEITTFGTMFIEACLKK